MLITSPDTKRHSFASSVGSFGATVRSTPPRKKMSMYSDEERKAVKQKLAKRKATLGLLRSSLEQTGPNVSHLEDDD